MACGPLQWAVALSKGLCCDGIRDPLEACDDGNLAGGDGCSLACGVEPFYVCLGGGPDVCVPLPPSPLPAPADAGGAGNNGSRSRCSDGPGAGAGAANNGRQRWPHLGAGK